MVQIDAFIKSMKPSWIKRLLTNDNSWTYLFEEVIGESKFTIISYGADYWRKKSKSIKNLFWKEVLENKPCFLYLPCNEESVLYRPLWHNPEIKIDNKTLHFKQWSRKGICYVYDLCNDQGKLIENYEEFCEKFSFSPILTQFYGIRNAILSKWPFLRNYNSTIILPHCQKYIYHILTNKQRGLSIYNLFIKDLTTNDKYKVKWSLELDIHQNQYWWEKINFIIFKLTSDSSLQWFQYRITHIIISTNKYLRMISVINSPVCSFCKANIESIIHLFWECTLVTKFWQEFTTWVENKTGKTLSLINSDVILGKTDNEINNINLIIVLAKLHIYKQKYKNHLPALFIFKMELEKHYKIEQYIHTKNMTVQKFEKRWVDLKALVT
ncbi:hypothetical protein CI610_03106 [invertebrate metagenome]|uniref:Reverse transcriptase zinc-binding domain-containing protein n=1 Tax=invertebrate metagenome TaxID=1711999 RepID=A0A2H9T446_9ZZZZ